MIYQGFTFLLKLRPGILESQQFQLFISKSTKQKINIRNSIYINYFNVHNILLPIPFGINGGGVNEIPILYALSAVKNSMSVVAQWTFEQIRAEALLPRVIGILELRGQLKVSWCSARSVRATCSHCF